MDAEQAEQNRIRLTRVDDVGGVDASWRTEVSAAVCAAEQASATLRRIVGELPPGEHVAWTRFASDLAAASLRFDAQLGTAAARVRADQAASSHERVPHEEHHDPLDALRHGVASVVGEIEHLLRPRSDGET